MQRHERTAFYHLPVHCGFCGKKVLTLGDEPEVDPCPHTLFVAHDMGFDFLSDRTAQQLRSKGCDVEMEDGVIEIEPAEQAADDKASSPEELTDDLEFPDGIKIACYVGPPSGYGTYVGFAPLDDE